MAEKFGADPKKMVAYIGPSAGACCYEVGQEVADRFPGYIIEKNGSQTLDLKGFNRDGIAGEGVPAGNIDTSAYCTICNPKLFHSYRRDGDRSGRMMFLAAISQPGQV